jgi:hypothetical protein
MGRANRWRTSPVESLMSGEEAVDPSCGGG